MIYVRAELPRVRFCRYVDVVLLSPLLINTMLVAPQLTASLLHMASWAVEQAWSVSSAMV